MVTILSIDGGGIRGLIPSRVIAQLQHLLDGTGHDLSISTAFDLVAGTSTGALMALGATVRERNGKARYSPSDIVDLYMRRGRQLFPPALRGTVHTAIQAFHTKYAAGGFESLLDEVFGDATLQSATTNLLVTSFDTQTMSPHCMKGSVEGADGPVQFDYYMRDAARASAAAPTYFPPALVSPVGHPELRYSLIDGGVFANNPAGLAYVESMKLFPSEEEFLILSLGTGHDQHRYRYDQIRSWGYLEWVNPAKGFPIGAMMSAGQSETVSHQLSRIRGVRYVRINTSLDGCASAIDDSSTRTLDCLNRRADRILAECERQLDGVCTALVSRRKSEVTTAMPSLP